MNSSGQSGSGGLKVISGRLSGGRKVPPHLDGRLLSGHHLFMAEHDWNK